MSPSQQDPATIGASNPKQQAGLHDDELLVESYPFEFVLGVLREDLPEVHDGRRWAVAERLVAAVRGAGPTSSDDSLASARGLTAEDAAAIEDVLRIADVLTRRILRSDGIPDAAWHARCRLEDALIDATVARTRLAQTREDTSVSSKPSSGAVPPEPQEENREHVETALAELNGLKNADLGRYERECLEAAEGALRRALSAVPLLQDGHDDV